MLKLGLVLFLFSAVVTETINKTLDSIYAKFHQSDYIIKPEWSEVVRFKQPEVKIFRVRTFKYNRTCPAVNLTIKYSIEVGNDLEIIFQLYKFASNEYRQFPLRFEVNFCKAVENNLIGMGDITKCGNFTTCYAQKGRTYHICNWTTDESKYPPYMPIGRYMLEVQGLYRDKELWLARNYAEVYRNIIPK